MRALLSFLFTLVTAFCFSQGDTARKIEPDQKTSFENYQLLLIALLGLAILIGLRFWFKRTRR